MSKNFLCTVYGGWQFTAPISFASMAQSAGAVEYTDCISAEG